MNNTAYKYNHDWYVEDVQPGDTVQRTTKSKSYYSSMRLNDSGVVQEIKPGSYYGHVVAGEYGYAVSAYHAKIKIDGTWYSMTNFKVTKKKDRTDNMVAMIEEDRPTYVREFKMVTTEDGTAEREYIGEQLSFKNMSAAKVYASNQISESIRKENTYRRFSILQEKFVAEAKQPEIEFK